MCVSGVVTVPRFTALLLWLGRRTSIDRDHFRGDPPLDPRAAIDWCHHRCFVCRTVHKCGLYRLYKSRPCVASCGRNACVSSRSVPGQRALLCAGTLIQTMLAGCDIGDSEAPQCMLAVLWAAMVPLPPPPFPLPPPFQK